MADEGTLPVRLYVMVRGESNEEMDRRLPEYRMVNHASGFLTVRSIKRQIDGALGAHGAIAAMWFEVPAPEGDARANFEELLGVTFKLDGEAKSPRLCGKVQRGGFGAMSAGRAAKHADPTDMVPRDSADDREAGRAALVRRVADRQPDRREIDAHRVTRSARPPACRCVPGMRGSG